MKTIQITIDESLLDEVDRATRDLKTNRSAFIREAVKLALQRSLIGRLEAAHAKGYADKPEAPGEVDIWEDEQAWGQP